jgi:hypothetical protein
VKKSPEVFDRLKSLSATLSRAFSAIFYINKLFSLRLSSKLRFLSSFLCAAKLSHVYVQR